MHSQHTYVCATILCALALVLACAATPARAAPGETQASNASHARAGEAQQDAPNASPTATPAQFDSFMSHLPEATRVLVTCSKPTPLGKPLENTRGEILLKPGQKLQDVCDLAHITSVDYLVPPHRGLPLPVFTHDPAHPP